MTDDAVVVGAERPPTQTWTIPPPDEAAQTEIEEKLRAMILSPEYPCVGARSVLKQGRALVRVHERLGSAPATERLLRELRDFAESVDVDDGFASYIAVFREPSRTTEERFERLLWRQLQLIATADRAPWSEEVSDDPANPHFSFSAAGTAFFVVGLHPDASRLARRAPWPTLVFNPHEQFERLRESGRFDRMQQTIRRRDVRLQGSVNPMVDDFGKTSEARQYSGRAVDTQWRPPAELGDTSTDGDRA